jgi:hypothetical protein
MSSTASITAQLMSMVLLPISGRQSTDHAAESIRIAKSWVL